MGKEPFKKNLHPPFHILGSVGTGQALITEGQWMLHFKHGDDESGDKFILFKKQL